MIMQPDATEPPRPDSMRYNRKRIRLRRERNGGAVMVKELGGGQARHASCTSSVASAGLLYLFIWRVGESAEVLLIELD
jgi:hypothetical protein